MYLVYNTVFFLDGKGLICSFKILQNKGDALKIAKNKKSNITLYLISVYYDLDLESLKS